MDLYRFDLKAMAGVLESWLDPEEIRPVLQRVPEVVPFLEQLDDVYARLTRILAAEEALDEELGALNRRAQQLGALHDYKMACISRLLTAVAEIVDAPAEKALLETTRDTLFPREAFRHDCTYAHQASFAVLAEMQLDLRMKHLLAGITFAERSLLDEYDEWVVIGKALGVVEGQRIRRFEALGVAGVSSADVRLVRNRWARIVGSILENISFPPSIDAATRCVIIGPLEAAARSIESSRAQDSSFGVLLDDIDFEGRRGGCDAGASLGPVAGNQSRTRC